MKKLISILIALGLLTHIAPTVTAKPKGDWNSVKALSNESVAVKTKTGGTTHYGLLQSVDDSSITIQIAGWDNISSQKISVKREEVAKVWRARLRFEDNSKKAVLIGTGVGMGIGLLAGGIIASNSQADPPRGATYAFILATGAGALAGKLWKKKHRKLDLVYSI